LLLRSTHDRRRALTYFGIVTGQPLSDIDLLELSDMAWQVIDPDGDYEGEEQAWATHLHTAGPPLAGLEELRTQLDELVSALSPPAPAVPVRAVAAVMAFLAAHPDRHDLGEALLMDALHDAFGADLPGDVMAWLSARRAQPGPRRRGHGAAQPRRTLGRRSPADTTSSDAVPPR
jgi:hypothetical protein